MFFYRVLLLRECSGVAEGPETLLRDVTQKVADIEGSIPLAVEVEVEQEEALAVHDDLVRVEGPVDAARRGPGRRCTEPVGGVEEPRDSSPPSRPRGRDGGEVRLQDVQLVGHHVALWGRDPRPVDLAGCLCDPPGQRDTATRAQELGGSTAGDLRRKPHLDL